MPKDSLGQISKTAFFIFSLPHAKEETFSPFPRVRKRRCKSERRKSIRRKIICERRGDRREKHSRLFECRIQKQNRPEITENDDCPAFFKRCGAVLCVPAAFFAAFRGPSARRAFFGGSKNAASVLESPKMAESENL